MEGVDTLYLDGEWTTVGPGDTVRMPMNLPHAYYNKGDEPGKSLFWVSPAGKLSALFDQLHNLEDPDEVVRRSALHDVNFLPPGSVPGARRRAPLSSVPVAVSPSPDDGGDE